MNFYNLVLSSNSTSAVQFKSEVIFNDYTTMTVNLSGLSETFIPIYLKIDWGDGTQNLYNNTLFKNYREDSIFNELLYGKFSSIFNDTYEHSYYPSSSALFKQLTAQIYVEYTNNTYYWCVQPIKVITGDYFETIYDIKHIETNILPLTSNKKQHHFVTDVGGFLIEAT